MVGGVKSFKIILSWLVFLLLIFFMIGAAVKPNFSQNLIDIYQLFSGKYADFFGLAICSPIFVAELGRYFNVFFGWQDAVSHHLLSPTLLSPLVAGGISLSPADLTPHLHFLASVMFLAALFLRFSGSAQSDLSAAARLSSRISEYAFYITNLNRFRHLWSYQFLLPFVLIISICRTHEVFRLIRQPSSKSSSPHEGDLKDDHETAEIGFKCIDEALICSLLTENSDITWPQQNAHCPYPDRKKYYKEHLEDFGVFKHLLYVKNQYSFLWVETSGLLICAVFVGQSLSLASVFKSSDHVYWKVLYGALCVGTMLLLAMKCLPGLLVRLQIGQKNLNNSDIKQLPDLILQYSWFQHMSRFIITLFSEGVPVTQVRILSWNIDLREFEGIELGFHAIIIFLARGLGRACLLFFAFCLKVTCLSNPISKLWCRWWPSLCNFAADLSVRDIWKTKRAILGAELALNTRKSCICKNCIITKSGTDFEELAIQMGIYRSSASPLSPDTDRERGIAVGLFNSNQEAIDKAGKNQEIVTSLRPALDLVKQFYIDAFEEKHDKAAAKVVEGKIQKCCDDAWSRYQASQLTCITEADWRLIKAQMLTSMLLRWLRRPSRADLDNNPLVQTLAGGPLYDWIDDRRDVHHCECDFITDFPP